MLCAVFLPLLVIGAAAQVTQPTTAAPDEWQREIDESEVKVKDKRKHDIMHIFGMPDFTTEVYITMKIKDSGCYSSATESAFTVTLGMLNFENELVGTYVIRSDEMTEYDANKSTKIFSLTVPSGSMQDPEVCFAEGRDPCVPRADVVFIQYHNEPEDSWSISHIEVDVQFRLWPGSENWHTFTYEHSVAMPCQSWMDDVAFYQIGPRNGLFLELKEIPQIGSWVRDWV